MSDTNESVGESSVPKRKRGTYGDYLSTPIKTVPRTTNWRRRSSSTTSPVPEEITMCYDQQHDQYEPNEDVDLSPSDNMPDHTVYCEPSVDPSYPSVELTDVEMETNEDLRCLIDQDEFDNFEMEDEEDEKAGEGIDSTSSESIGDRYIYPGAQITLATSLLLTIAFVCRHSLSGEAVVDLLTYVELHCLAGSLCTTSMKIFRQFFTNSRAPLECHYYCIKSTCKLYFGKSKDQVPNICKACCTKQDKAAQPYFLMNPLDTALKNLFASPGFAEQLKYSVTRSKKSQENIEDVFDGNLYKEHFDNGFFRGQPHHADEVHISMQLNTDGVSIFESSKFSVWPVFVVINELHPKLRFSRSNRILMGLWFGSDKPNFESFMMPFAKSLNELYYKGNFTTKIFILSLISAPKTANVFSH
ncbi:uncharacterized protein [Asterias amurensis]|uniref:uncharacterized protein n=1 Tax=Asterias amurensis TaxID=7602 RepID=UPI003AB63B0C